MSPEAVLPARDCAGLLLWDIAVLARASWLRPGELRTALEKFLSGSKERKAAEALRDDLVEIAKRRSRTGAELA